MYQKKLRPYTIVFEEQWKWGRKIPLERKRRPSKKFLEPP